MRVEIDYAFADPDADEPKFTVRVSQLDGDVLFAVNSFTDDFDRDVPRPRGSVALVIPELPLLQGRFLLSVSLSTKRDTEIYHALERWLEFSVFAPTTGDGVVAVERSWELVDEGAQPVEAYTEVAKR
jgi:hypothetical protein